MEGSKILHSKHCFKIDSNVDGWEGWRSFQVESSHDGKSETPMSAILHFCDRFLDFFRDLRPNDKIVIIPESSNHSSFVRTYLYLGFFMIICDSMSVEEVQEALRDSTPPSQSPLVQDSSLINFASIDALGEVRIIHCWRAIEQTVSLRWLVVPESNVQSMLDVEELEHYACRANGSLHMVVPGRMFFFPTPDDLPDGQQWADNVARSGATIRRFSASFYAELFKVEELNVSMVACLGQGSEAAAAAFEARGVEAVDLGLAEDGSSLLRGLDRLLSLSWAVPGAVAVYSGRGSEWPGYLETLVAAFLIRREGFDEGAARAWLRMVSPWSAGGGDDGWGPAGAEPPAARGC